MKKLLLLVFSLLFVVLSAWAQISPVYVNVATGMDTYDGSSATVGTFPVGPKATIQAGINVASSGGTVNVAAGTYTEQILIQKSLVLTGAGNSQTFVKAPTSGMLTAPLYGPGYDQTDGLGYILAAYPAAYGNSDPTISVKITGFNFDDNNQSGIGARNTAIYFRKVANETIGDAGLFDCIVNTFTDAEASGMWVLDGSKLTVNGNTFNDNVEFGIYVLGKYPDQGDNTDPLVTTSNNTVNSIGSGAESIQYRNLSNPSIAGTISGNIVNGGAGGNNDIVAVVCDHIVINGNNQLSYGATGIMLEESNFCTIQSNTVSNTSYDGIEIYHSNNNTILSNVISLTPIGIDILDVSSSNTATGNDITLCGTGFYNIAGSTGNVAHNNKIYLNTTIGLQNDDPNVMDATNNWWGYASGPFNDPTNTCGLGNGVTSNVTFIPWWTTSTGVDGSGTPPVIHNTIKNKYYCTIQEAINDATAGNTIEVGTGTYLEHILINKSLTLKKATDATPVIDGAGSGVVVTINANYVRLEGFTIQHSGADPELNAGVAVVGVIGCTVIGNEILNNVNGVVLMGSNTNMIQANLIHENARYGIFIGIFGDSPTYSTYNSISGNTITANVSDGIYVDRGSDHNIIEDNLISGTIGQIESGDLEGNGIYLWKSGSNTVFGNTISDNETNGIELMGSSNNNITDNTITGNNNGIMVRRSDSYAFAPNLIYRNIISGNTVYGLGTNFTGSDPSVIATNNWWGDATGPYNNPHNKCGLGDDASDYVNFMPWWTTSTGTDGSGTLAVHNTSKATYYCKIQDAIDDATAGNTIEAGTGTYLEHILINKSLTLNKASAAVPVIDGGGTDIPVIITADNVTFDGFTVRNSGLTGHVGGILLGNITGLGVGTGVTGCTIQNNTLTTSVKGIILAFGSGNTIKSNVLTANGDWSILLGASTGNDIESNTISNNNAGAIYLDNQSAFGDNGSYNLGSTGNTIHLNTITNTITGEVINLGENCNGNFVTDNTLIGGAYGIHIWKSSNQTITGNTISNFNTLPRPGYSAVAIRLRNAQNNTITGNTITSNMKGFEIVANEGEVYCTGNEIHNNNISGNGSGIDASPSNGNYIVNATCNWWGTLGSGAIDALVSDWVTYTPYLLSGTDDEPGTPGFQQTTPVCSTVTDLYVNDDNITNDALTTAIGNDANIGTAAAPFRSVQHAISVAGAGNTIHVDAGDFTEISQIVINKNLTIVGLAKDKVTIKPDQNTSGGALDTDGSGWLLINSGINFNLSNVTLDGTGKDIQQGIITHGSGTINNCIIKEIKSPVIPNPTYVSGMGVRIVSTGTVNITNSQFSEIGRVGILFKDAATSTISGNTYTGKGAVSNAYDYAVEVQFGAHVTITGNTISNNLGVYDGYGSSAITVWGDIGDNVTIENNTLTNNGSGIAIACDGWSAPGYPVVTIGDGNLISGGEKGVAIENVGAGGSPTLLFGSSTFKGQTVAAMQIQDAMSVGMVYDISATIFKNSEDEIITDNFAIEDLVYHVIDAPNRGMFYWNMDNVYVTPESGNGSLQRAIDNAGDNETIHIKSGSYNGHVNTVTGNKNITLNPGASPGCVGITGNLVMNTLDVLTIEVNGTEASCPVTQFDQIAVTGGVTLGGATLNLLLGYAPAPGAQFTIISNDLVDPISGTFAQGNSITLDFGGSPYTFGINYTGGDGNDLVLTYCGTGPTASFAGSTAICQGSPANLVVNFTGASPFDFIYKIGAVEQPPVLNVTSPFDLVVNPAANTVYTITNVTDANNCSNPANSQATVYTGPITTAPDILSACPGTLIEFPISVSSFANVGAISLSMNYDNRVMTFDSFIDNSGLIDFCQAVVTGDDGVVRFSGTPNPPAELADDAVLITLKFNYINGNTDLAFDDSQDTWCEYGSGPPDYIPFCDDQTGTYNINGSVTAAAIPTVVYVDDNFNPTTAGWHCDKFATIQEGIDRVELGTGGTVNVAAGTYIEQLTIHKNVTLLGVNKTTTIVQAPATGHECVAGITGVGTNWQSDYLLAAYPLDWNGPTATGTLIDVKVSGFTFDANGIYNSCGRYSGIFFGCVNSSTAGLFDSRVINFDPADPSATGVRILGNSKLSVKDCDNIEYTINGIAAYGDLTGTADPEILIDNNTLYCIKTELVWNEYAINVCFGATGTVSNNTVTDPAIYGVLISSSDNVTVIGNTISNQWAGIYMLYANNNHIGTAIAGNTISNCYGNGIIMVESDNNIFLKNSISYINSGSTETIGSCGWGIGFDYLYDAEWNPIPGSSNNTNQVGDGSEANANIINNCDAGIAFFCPGTGNTVNGNKIYSNTPHGLNNIGGSAVIASRNWWGSSRGPTVTGYDCGNGDAITNETGVTWEPWKDASWNDVYKLAATAAVTTPITCFGGTGSVTLSPTGGIAAYSYTFNGTTQTTAVFDGISVGVDYPWSVTDANLCTVSGTLTVTQPDVLYGEFSQTNVTCNGANDGKITFTNPDGGNGTYEVSITVNSWQTITVSYEFTNLTPGTYDAFIRDKAYPACEIDLGSIEITQPALLTATVVHTDVTCYGANDGTITITSPAGGYGTFEYSINNSTWQSSGSFTGLAPALQAVYIRDAAHTACFVPLQSQNITQPDVLNAIVVHTDVTCNGVNDGTITISSPVGGYGTFEYSIDNSAWQSSGSFTTLAPAVYPVYIRDAAHTNCFVTLISQDVTQPGVLTANVAHTDITCNGANDGTITITSPAGGYGTFEFSIDNQNWQSSGSFTALAPAIYPVYIRDAAHINCYATLASQDVTQPGLLSATVSHTEVTCNGANNGTITITSATGGYGTFEYSINNSTWQSSGIFTGLPPALQPVYIRDAAHTACFATLQSQDISQPEALTATVTHTNITCNGANDGTITVTNPSGGYGTFEYRLNTGPWQTSGSFTNLSPNIYSVQIRDAANTACSIDLGNQVVVQPGVLSATVSKTDATCNGANDGSITVSSPSGGHGTYEYRLNSGTWQASGSFTGLAPATYSVQIRDAAYTACSIVLGDQIVTEPAANVVSGNFYYYSTDPTSMPLDGVSIGLKQGGSTISTTTDVNGSFTFPNVCAGSYEVVATKDNPVGSINATDAAQANWWGVHYGEFNPPIEKVRFYAGDVYGLGQYPDNTITASDASRIQEYFVSGGITTFTRLPWAFWLAGVPMPSNPLLPYSGYQYPTIDVTASGSYTFYGLVTGDFNRSFNPNPLKAGEANLELVYKETRIVGANTLFDLPVMTTSDLTVGAVSMILNFPSNLAEVTGVNMVVDAGVLNWAVYGDELRIGWNSQTPLNLAAGSELLTISLKTTGEFITGQSIRLALVADPMNELADNYFDVIPDAILAVDVIESSSTGIDDVPVIESLSLANYPNPFFGYTTISYSLPFDGEVTMEVSSTLGTRVGTLVNATQLKGNYTYKFDANGLPPGVFTVTLRLKSNNDQQVRTIKIIRAW